MPSKDSLRSRAGTTASFAVIWEFRVTPRKRRAFERAYAREGVWAKFFRKGKGYIGTELIHDHRDPRRYLTLDFWKSRKHYENFKKQNQMEYEAIDAKCEVLTTTESEIGQFSRLLRSS